MSKSGLTEEEQKLIGLTADLWNAYNELPEQHPCDKEEFCHALHICQHLIMIRSVRRMDTDMFPAYEKDENTLIAEEIGKQIKDEIEKEFNVEK